ncbi:hypothetical protein LXA47_15895 [Massilia sp. P8910]|uniref:hypothetical protein n=1 Tax=Massilia antarctica TaxID=2765360 RepID=UPI001E60F87B|nr:hypothetical protein [Massilia antarctica]MCE3605084.1 hypothetical protein [Massilia antarctica]
MSIVAQRTWTSGSNGPKTVEELRKAMAKAAGSKSGKDLISTKFTDDHIFIGHSGDAKTLSIKLAKLRERPLSTLLISSMDASAQREVLNWIANVPAARLTYQHGVWTIANAGTTVQAVNSYKWLTVDMDELENMNADDVDKKKRKWLKESTKTPQIACMFSPNGTPLIYHLDY